MAVFFTDGFPFGERLLLKCHRRAAVAILCAAGYLLPPAAVQAKKPEWLAQLKNDVELTWQEPQAYDFYLPAISWHARFAYDQNKIDRYNENPWGAGFGRSRHDENGNWHSLYVMMFKDSHNQWEPIVGYGWEKTWRSAQTPAFYCGVGYTFGVTMREQADYLPLPVLLPLASINYEPLSLQMTYIPGGKNSGNVLFAWLRYQFKLGNVK